MNTGNAERIVVGALVATAIVATANSVADTGDLPGVRLVAGGFLAGALLLALAQPAPEIAAGLAGIALLSTLIRSGDTLTGLADQLKGKPNARQGS